MLKLNEWVVEVGWGCCLLIVLCMFFKVDLKGMDSILSVVDDFNEGEAYRKVYVWGVSF